jgi:hypothetical protein
MIVNHMLLPRCWELRSVTLTQALSELRVPRKIEATAHAARRPPRIDRDQGRSYDQLFSLASLDIWQSVDNERAKRALGDN